MPTGYKATTPQDVQCPALTPPVNGALSPAGVNSYNTEVIFTCNQGYKLEGASSVRCQANSTWSGTVPNCTVVQCPELTPPANGSLSPTGVNLYNDEVIFTCNQGYELLGASSMRCQANRTWSDPVPTCTDIDACLANPCDTNATCTDNPAPALDATCTCNTGYTGDGLVNGTGCADVDACLANPCDAQATCTDNPAPALDATCTCNTGYTGDGLTSGTGCTDIDACLANPCDAQATCTDNPAPALDATCTCNTGYTGDGLVNGTGCSDIDACLANPCDAHATCTDNPAPALDANCTCNTGYTGDGLVNGTGCAAVQCPALTPPANGALSPTGVNSYNDEVMFTCNQGYEMEGASSVRCQANRTWSGPVPTCTDADECAASNGRCDHICSNFPGGYRCFCGLGFVLMEDAHGCGAYFDEGYTSK
ncbi:P-selectin-like [Branchiostoma floridae]|uniref:P-selectin-like n=1 Tax=Branchiostoma floridae TaxID=7739 RepID=A0A9J7HVD1_BRAFL|nr:P-selectin-like [Branchiostoma floridae]